MLVVSWASDKTRHAQGRSSGRSCWSARLAFARLLDALGSTHFWLSYALLVIAGAAMYAPVRPVLRHRARAAAAATSPAGAMALINSMGALGSFVGSYGSSAI